MQARIAGDLLKRVFGGSAKSLIMGALGAQPASAEELAEIRQMMDALDKQKRGSK
jgi:predicted transcriptional regulator